MLTLSSAVVGGGGRVPAGGALKWTLANDGELPWPAESTFRLVVGPVGASHAVAIPPVAPGQALDIELDFQDAAESAEVIYSLVTPDGQPFGEMAHASIEGKPKPKPDPKPLIAVIASPMDAVDGQLRASQGELKCAEWILGNVGQAPWPNDVSVNLVYNTPGMESVSCSMELPALDPGMTVHATMSALMPEQPGTWKAIWIASSPSEPDFGEVLVAEFSVDEPPPAVDSSSAAVEPSKPLSVSVAKEQHHFLGAGDVDFEAADIHGVTSLGRVTGVRAGDKWILEMVLTNDGAEAWPDGSALACCLGSGMGCPKLALDGDAVKPGESVLVAMELTAPTGPETSAWVLTKGDQCFGNAMMMEVGKA